MKLSKEAVLKQVIEVLKDICESEEIVITPDINPVENLAIDSGHGIPFAFEMEDRLSIEIPEDLNPFYEDGPTPRTRTVGEIVDLLIEISEGQKEG